MLWERAQMYKERGDHEYSPWKLSGKAEGLEENLSLGIDQECTVRIHPIKVSLFSD